MIDLRLVTIGVSHYCEKARWALDRAGLAYVEEAHAPILHYAATVRWGTRRHLPALLGRCGKLVDSTEIIAWVDEQTPVDRRLIPADAALRTEALGLEDRFDEKLGPATRRWVYSWALHDRPLLVQALQSGLPPLEAAAVRATHPLIVAGLVRGLGLSDAAAERSQARIAEIFEEVGARLADGRRYLVGDRFGVADLAFAALAAPVVLPSEYGASMPALGELPEPMRRTVEIFQETAAGRFALRVYREHRR